MVSVKTTIAEITELVEAAAAKFDTDDDAERAYLVERLPPRLVGRVEGLSVLSLHLMDHMAGGTTNIVGLAASSRQLKGTVSKHVQRLVEAGLVRRDAVPGNRKEVALSLTSDGETVTAVHRDMHDEQNRGIEDFLARYSDDELATVAKILRDLLNSEKRGLRLVTGTGR